jgi:hypothetical protein
MRFQAPLVLGGHQFRAQIVEPLLLAGFQARRPAGAALRRPSNLPRRI